MPLRLKNEEFIRKAQALHGDRYIYDLVAYAGLRKHVSIICTDHGEFLQWPANHLVGKGCPKCAGFGFSLDERFWSFVNKDGPTQKHMDDCCWEWKGSKNHFGYGHLWKNGAMVAAHNVSWEIHFGDIPEHDNHFGRLLVLHRCDLAECTRPNHLFLGTHADNARDMARKARSTTGEKSGRATLTWSVVREIRTLWASGQWRQSDLAEKYGTSDTNVWSIVHGKRWIEVIEREI